jgi:protein TonB
MQGNADKAPRRVRIGTVVLVALIHVGIGIGLVRMFAPDLTAAIVHRVVEAYTVIITGPPPEPDAAKKAKPDAGAAAEEGRKSRPREVSAPRQPRQTEPLPPVSSTGRENASGAAEQGSGTGAGGQGSGTGSGQGGNGQGGGARRLEMIAGDISSARDYRKKTRDLRIGQSVTILLSVGTDGRVTGCKVTAPSPDPEADATTCRLATERFRFRPALDRGGNPVSGQYAWRQRWYYDQPGEAE